MKKLRYFFEILLLELAVWLLPRLPRRVLMALSRRLGTLAYWVDKRGRNTALENLRCAFGDQYTLADRQRIARGSYQVFARTFVDLFWSSKLTAETWQRHFDIHIADPGAEEKARQNGAVWVTPHFGNFELVSQVLDLLRGRWSLCRHAIREGAASEVCHDEGDLVSRFDGLG